MTEYEDDSLIYPISPNDEVARPETGVGFRIRL